MSDIVLPSSYPAKQCQPHGHECHRMAVGQFSDIIVPDAFHSGSMPGQTR
jgi:hypothetical protein